MVRFGTTRKVSVPVDKKFLVSSDVEESASGIVGACAEGVVVGEEGDGVDVRLVPRERLDAAPRPHVPQLSRRVATPRHESVTVVTFYPLKIVRFPAYLKAQISICGLGAIFKFWRISANPR